MTDKKKFEFNQIQLDWLAALRSGDYKQTTDYLCEEGSYCCLGVALHLVDPENESLEDNYGSLDNDNVMSGDEKHVIHKYGFKDGEGYIDTKMMPPEDSEKIVYGSLAALNDNGWTFKEIADFVETYPEAVFNTE